jgi:hypothetical protein
MQIFLSFGAINYFKLTRKEITKLAAIVGGYATGATDVLACCIPITFKSPLISAIAKGEFITAQTNLFHFL